MNNPKRIMILGGESTGKSTLCEQLALHYNTVWVPEYSRRYLETLNRVYHYDDLCLIAKEQMALEDQNYPLARRFLFCDTGLDIIKVWSEHKYQRCDDWILNEIKSRPYDAYIVTAPDFPWQSDALREHPEPAMRTYFFQKYLQIVKAKESAFCIVTGSMESRLKNAIKFLDANFPGTIF